MREMYAYAVMLKTIPKTHMLNLTFCVGLNLIYQISFPKLGMVVTPTKKIIALEVYSFFQSMTDIIVIIYHLSFIQALREGYFSMLSNHKSVQEACPVTRILETQHHVSG